ncbi:hypothetical protein D3C71_1579600 [compost metagenome]
MHAAAGHALDDLVFGHIDLKNDVDLHAGKLHRIRLRKGAGEAVEQETIDTIGLGDARVYEADDDVVAHESACIHHALGSQTDRRAGLSRRAQHVAGGQVGDAKVLRDAIGLCALSGAGRP